MTAMKTRQNQNKMGPATQKLCQDHLTNRDSQCFGQCINNPFTDAQLISIAENIILNTGMFKI
jgi:hypothetical protein